MTGTENIGENSALGGRMRGWLGAWNSPALMSRIAVGFAALCLVKLILIFSLRKQLFEIHYRVSEEAPDWLNSVAFYLFAGLAGLNLWKLGTRCMPAGARVVRAANICVLFLCALFIFLTFHAGDNNYLYAVMTDILTWKSVGWYLYNDSCYQMPFLGAWVFAYALAYYGFWSKGREQLMLRVTAVFATAYILICLRDFREYRNPLIIADCLGIACLMLSGAGKLNPFWMALPIVGAGSLFILFRPFQSGLALGNLNNEFSVLLWGCLTLFTGVTLMAWRRGFLAGWWRILPFVMASFLLVNTNYPAYPNLENLLCMGFMLPRYFLGEFGIMVVLFAVAILYRKLLPKGTLLWLDVINLLLVTIALADLRLTQIMSVRLDYDVISLAAGETTKMMWRMAQPYLPSLVWGVLALTVVYAFSLWIVARVAKSAPSSRTSHPRGEREMEIAGATESLVLPERQNKPSNHSIVFAIVACLLLGIAGVHLAPGDKAEGQTLIRFAETSPLLKHSNTPVMDRATFVKTATELGMAEMCAPVASTSAHPRRDLNVIVIFQESTYNKHLSLFGSKEETQPLLSQYKDRMELFPNFFSVFAGSMNARFATFTGMYPLGDYHTFTAERVPVKSIFEALHDNGYACSMFYSSFFDYTDFRDFLRNRDLDGMYDADTMPGTRTNKPVSWGLQEEDTLGAIQQQIKSYAASKQKFFLTYVPAAPHNPFDGTPRQFQKHRMEKVGDLTPLYINELLYMDWTITSIIDELKQSGLLDNTLVVITADHGEMLGDNGGPVGHGWALTPELANVPLIIMDPAHHGYRVNDTIGSQVDLMPTILDSLGIALPSRQLYQGASLYSPNLNTNRTIYLNTFRQYGMIRGASFISGDRETDKPGSASSRQVFEITNEGAHTVFTPSTKKAQNDTYISLFDDFQKNVLRNYSVYGQILSSP